MSSLCFHSKTAMFTSFIACILVIAHPINGNLLGQEVKTAIEQATPLGERIKTFLRESSQLYVVSTVEHLKSSKTPPAYDSLPSLTWTNDVRESHSVGWLVLHVEEGRPVAAVAAYIWNNQLTCELDCLARSEVVCMKGDLEIWRGGKGLTFSPVPNSPEVASSPVARLRQMKQIADQFSCDMTGWRIDESDREQLRRLPKELYLYPNENAGVIDGAVFSFALGTDPEALLILEATETDQKKQWEFAFVRQTSGGLEAKHNGLVVWSAEKHPNRNRNLQLGRTINNDLPVPAELKQP